MLRRFVILASAFAALASCATSRPMSLLQPPSPVLGSGERVTALKSWIAQEERLLRVATPLMSANTDLCGRDVAPWLGLYTATTESFAAEWQSVARDAYGVGGKPVVLYDIEATPAYQAGLRRGDVITAVNGQRLRPGEPLDGTQGWQTEVHDLGHLDVVYEREGMIGALRINAVESCNYEVVLEDNEQINAFADGRHIIVSTGLLRFVESDDELALILAHEMAHNALEHIEQRRRSARTGGMGGLFIDLMFAAAGIDTNGEFTKVGMRAGALSYSMEFEREADYVALYYLARAGTPAEADLAEFWRRVASISPESIDERFTHPTLPERYSALKEAAGEIARKRAEGIALLPNPGGPPSSEPAVQEFAAPRPGKRPETEKEPPVDFSTPLDMEADGEAGV